MAQQSGQTAAPAAPKEKQMPAEMREFDNAEDYAEACFYDYYDLVVAESIPRTIPSGDRVHFLLMNALSFCQILRLRF